MFASASVTSARLGVGCTGEERCLFRERDAHAHDVHFIPYRQFYLTDRYITQEESLQGDTHLQNGSPRVVNYQIRSDCHPYGVGQQRRLRSARMCLVSDVGLEGPGRVTERGEREPEWELAARDVRVGVAPDVELDVDGRADVLVLVSVSVVKIRVRVLMHMDEGDELYQAVLTRSRKEAKCEPAVLMQVWSMSQERPGSRIQMSISIQRCSIVEWNVPAGRKCLACSPFSRRTVWRTRTCQRCMEDEGSRSYSWAGRAKVRVQIRDKGGEFSQE